MLHFVFSTLSQSYGIIVIYNKTENTTEEISPDFNWRMNSHPIECLYSVNAVVVDVGLIVFDDIREIINLEQQAFFR